MSAEIVDFRLKPPLLKELAAFCTFPEVNGVQLGVYPGTSDRGPVVIMAADVAGERHYLGDLHNAESYGTALAQAEDLCAAVQRVVEFVHGSHEAGLVLRRVLALTPPLPGGAN